MHADGEPARLPVCRAAVADGTIPPGYAADDGVALLFRGLELEEVVSSRPGRRALRIEPDGETELKPRMLAKPDRFGPAPEIAEFRAVRALASARRCEGSPPLRLRTILTAASAATPAPSTTGIRFTTGVFLATL